MANRFLADRAIIRLSPTDEGEDVVAFLQGLVTNDVSGDWLTYAALLSPQGKVLFDFLVEREYVFPEEPGLIGRLRDRDWRSNQHWKPSGDVLIDCEASRAEALVRRLSLYRLRRKINIAVDPSLCVRWPEGYHDGFPDPRFPATHQALLGYRWIGPRLPGMVDGSAAYLAQRLSHGIAEGVAELGDGETLWLECNAAELNGVSFSKGCYVGQENTARMNWRSTVNRRVVVVPIADADPKRQRVAYPDLGWSVEHRRVEDIPAGAWRDWMGERSNPAA